MNFFLILIIHAVIHINREIVIFFFIIASGGRYTDNGQVKLNGTALPQNDSSPVYFQLIATKGQQASL